MPYQMGAVPSNPISDFVLRPNTKISSGCKTSAALPCWALFSACQVHQSIRQMSTFDSGEVNPFSETIDFLKA